MNFFDALLAIHNGDVLTRRKWQGTANVYLVSNKANNIKHVEVRVRSNCIMYSASSEDMFAEDWEIVNKKVQDKQLNQDEIVL